MAKTKEQKKEALEILEKNLKQQKGLYFIDFEKLKTRDLSELRKQLGKNQALLLIVKKRLAEIVFEKNNISVDVKNLGGQVGLIFSFEESVLPAKIIYNFSQEHKAPQILGAYLSNKFINKEEVIELAKLPSMNELLSRLVRQLNAPAYNLVNVLQNNIKGLVYLLSNINT